MNHRDKIISSVADQECEHICAVTISALQGMADGMQSGDDTTLENIWDEICVQVQYEQSMFNDAYLDTVTATIIRELEGVGWCWNDSF